MQVDRYTKIMLAVIAAGLWTLIIKDVLTPQPAIAGISLSPTATEGVAMQCCSGTLTIHHYNGAPPRHFSD